LSLDEKQPKNQISKSPKLASQKDKEQRTNLPNKFEELYRALLSVFRE